MWWSIELATFSDISSSVANRPNLKQFLISSHFPRSTGKITIKMVLSELISFPNAKGQAAGHL